MRNHASETVQRPLALVTKRDRLGFDLQNTHRRNYMASASGPLTFNPEAAVLLKAHLEETPGSLRTWAWGGNSAEVAMVAHPWQVHEGGFAIG